MNLAMSTTLASSYKSRAQMARVVTEAWGEVNLFCANCQSPLLDPAKANTKAYDYSCPECGQFFQLKSKSSAFGNRIIDAALAPMLRAIAEDRTPNLFALHYERASWSVKNLILIPHFAFSASAIEARKPLGPQARRAGWVGCIIVLDKIPPDARIPLVKDGVVVNPVSVRQNFLRLRQIQQIPVKERGWLLDVLRIVRSLGKTEFTNNDVYQFVPELQKLHPQNRHIRDKIRQQLQFLRDRAFVTQVERGVWSLKQQGS